MKKPLIFASVALFALVSVGIYFYFKKDIRKIEPPIPSLDVPFTEYVFDAQKGTKIDHFTGTTITIAPDVFVDEDKNVVKGEIVLRYRELHSTTDIFVSGVPMQYDSAGKTKVLQSAGMFEMQARQAQNKLEVGTNKNIDVRFASFKDGSDYNFYQWKDGQGNWNFEKGAEKPEPNLEKKRILDSLNNLDKNPKNLFVLHFGEALDIYFNYSNEKVMNKVLQANFKKVLKAYALDYSSQIRNDEPVKLGKYYYPAYHLVWQSVDSVAFPNWLKTEENRDYARDNSWWTDIKSSWKKQKDGTYRFTVQKIKYSTKTKEIIKYDTVYQVNKKTKQRRIKEIKERKEKKYIDVESVVNRFSFAARPYVRFSDFLKKKPENYSAEYQDAMAEIERVRKNAEAMADVFRKAEVKGMGVHNYDKIYKNDQFVHIKGEFEVEKNGKPDNVYYVSQKNNFVIKYEAYSYDKVSLEKDETARIFSVMPDFSLAFYDNKKLQSLNLQAVQSKGSHFFDLKINPNQAKTREELSKILGF